jgi:DNA-binding CsgD family transcriptional regulator
MLLAVAGRCSILLTDSEVRVLVTSERLSRLLLLVYESASTPGQMQTFLDALIKTMDAKGAVIREHVFSTEQGVRIGKTTLAETIGYSDEALARYRDYIHRNDIYLKNALERYRDADCGFSQSLVTEAERKQSETYADYMVPFDIGPMAWAKLAQRPDCHASISIVRHDGAEFFDNSSLELLTALTPHLRQALKLSRSLAELQTTNAMLTDSLDGMQIAICLVKQDGSVLRSTAGATRLFDLGDGISLRSGRLRTRALSEQATLDSMIAGACLTGAGRGFDASVRVGANAAGGDNIRSWTGQAGGAMLISRKLPARPMQVVVYPFCSGTLASDAEATALVQINDPSAIPRSRGAVLRALYGLTPSESRLADALLEGLEVREAADRLGITVESARFNLKRILAKTDTHRQAELMRLILSLPGARKEP